MVKRVVATILWFNAMWVVGAAAAYVMDLPSLTAPLLATASALFVGFDPRHVFWHQAVREQVGETPDPQLERSATTA